MPGALPSACITWFQAEQACRLSGKRLLTNQEWQAAAAGTPQTGLISGPMECNTNSTGPTATGSRPLCKSSWGLFDMAGNVAEWVADWVPRSTNCPGWSTFSTNDMCLSGAFTTAFGPGALIRGGDWGLGDGTLSGPFTVYGNNYPYTTDPVIGFRCAR
ncbi:MAG TPA: SUMF1/EgtB/PvdO family nonheme iron enzyme [Candidatus Binatia bacterium]